MLTTCVPQTTLGALITGAEGKAFTVTSAVTTVVQPLVFKAVSLTVFTPKLDHCTVGELVVVSAPAGVLNVGGVAPEPKSQLNAAGGTGGISVPVDVPVKLTFTPTPQILAGAVKVGTGGFPFIVIACVTVELTQPAPLATCNVTDFAPALAQLTTKLFVFNPLTTA
jgi:hypothetical protein